MPAIGPEHVAGRTAAVEHEGPLRGERPAQPGERQVAHVVEDHVVPRRPVGEVLRRVVDDVRGAERAHQLDVARAAHPGDLGAQRRRDLDGVRADPAAGPVDEHPLAGLHLAHVPDPAQGRRRRHGDRGRLLEGQARRLGHHLVCRGARVLGERAPEEAEHLVAGLQPAHVRADRLHHARRVDPGHPGLRLGQPHAHEPRDDTGRLAAMCQSYGVERGGVHPDQHVVGPDLGPVGVDEPQHVRRAEPLLDDRLHRMPPGSDVRARWNAPVCSERVTSNEERPGCYLETRPARGEVVISVYRPTTTLADLARSVLRGGERLTRS